jgi:hypothetical protein
MCNSRYYKKTQFKEHCNLLPSYSTLCLEWRESTSGTLEVDIRVQLACLSRIKVLFALKCGRYETSLIQFEDCYRFKRIGSLPVGKRENSWLS